MSSAVHHDVSAPLRDMKPATGGSHVHPALHGAAVAQRVVHADDTSGQLGRARIPPTIVNFEGVTANLYAPPDTVGAAGTTQYVQMTNVRLAVYSKTGTILMGPVNSNTLWSGFGGTCQTNNDGDGFVLWDTLANRWVISQFALTFTPNPPNLECVAVSTTSDATGTYNRYSFPYADWPDYPKMGVWPDAYYASFNMFNNAGTQALGTKLCAYDRVAMLAGAAATQQCFQPYVSGTQTQLPASLEGSTAPSVGENEFFAGLSTSANNLAYFKFHVDWTTPGLSTLSGPTNLAVTPFSLACGNGGTCIPQSGTATQLDSLGERVMARLAYRKFSDHESLVVTHSITAGTSVGARWYELRVSGGNLTVFQQGTVAPDTSYRWMGSIASDQSGDLALGFSVSSASLHPGIRYTGRLPGDPLGTMPQGEGTIFTGLGSQTSGLTRWGDYSAMTVDPVDDCTFWYTNEYIPANGSFNWHTRIASFKFPSCGGTPTNDFSMSANPTSITVTQGGSGTSTISTVITSGAAQSVTLSATGLPSGATAGFNPNPINSGTSSLMTIDTLPTTPLGTSTVTVTGTGTDVTRTTSVSLTVANVTPGIRSDFNGDGFADLAIGVPLENIGSIADTGAVNVIYGSAAGLSAVSNQFWDEAATGSASDGSSDWFGTSAASGDFNGDGFADLAVGVPGKNVGAATDAGAVSVLYGSLSGLVSAGSQQWNQNGLGTDPAETGDEFGWSVAGGDVNGDGFDDLAVGVVTETVSGNAGAGAVNLILGSAAGLTATGNQFWNQDSTGIRESAAVDDNMGNSVALGDFNADGFADLATGVPGEKIGTVEDAGAVDVLFGTAAGLTEVDDQLWDQDSTDINDKCEVLDIFGLSVATGDIDGDGFADLLVGVPLENIGSVVAAGAANAIYGSAAGLAATGDEFWHQDRAGINEVAQAYDEFGWAVAIGDFNDDGFGDAAIGVPGEDIGTKAEPGAANVIYGTSAGLDSAGDDLWDQDSTDIKDTAEDGDLFGWSLAVGEFGNGPEEDLAIGVVLEDIVADDAGAVNVIYGSPSDLTATGNQRWYQGSADILDDPEENDEFGFGLGTEPATGMPRMGHWGI